MFRLNRTGRGLPVEARETRLYPADVYCRMLEQVKLKTPDTKMFAIEGLK